MATRWKVSYRIRTLTEGGAFNRNVVQSGQVYNTTVDADAASIAMDMVRDMNGGSERCEILFVNPVN